MMRTWGRTTDEYGNRTWVEVVTDANGYNDSVMLTALIQWLQLNLGESPFYANAGIPAQQTVITQVFPDYYAMIAQTVFSAAFASLTIQRVPNFSPPTYQVNVTTHTGAQLSQVVAT